MRRERRHEYFKRGEIPFIYLLVRCSISGTPLPTHGTSRRRVPRFEWRVELFHTRLVAKAELGCVFPADGIRVDVGETVGIDGFSEVDGPMTARGLLTILLLYTRTLSD